MLKQFGLPVGYDYPSLSVRSSSLALAVVSLMFVLAVGARVYNIQKPYVGLLPVREFRSAIIAMDIVFTLNPELPEWQRNVAHVSREREWSLEPPILEGLTALTFHLTGTEQLWIPRLYATLFWMIGGVFFWQCTRHLFGRGTAVFLIAYYLFVPIGVIASKSFQPDTLMMLLYLAFLWAFLRYDEEPTRRRLLWAALASSLALFARPLSLFPILGALVGLTIYRLLRREHRPFSHFVLFGVALSLGLAYYAYGLFIASSLAGQAEITFRPHLLLMREFWTGWIYTGLDAVQLFGAIAALVGLTFVHSPRLKWLLIGLWASYFVFGVIFNYHISTHNYYHIQLIPTIALSAGSLISLLLMRLQGLSRYWLRTMWLSSVFALLVVIALWQVVQQGRRELNFEAPALAQEIGALVQHSTTTVYLSPFYGRPLEYFGQLSGAYWPRSSTRGIYDPNGALNVSVEDRLAALDFVPDYFVITDLAEFQQHHSDLTKYLHGNCDLLAQASQYLIYEHCRGFVSPTRR